MKNLYEILGIEKTTTSDQIKKAYFALAKKYHPDSSDDAEVKKFYEITEAYKILSDKEERRAYDLTLEGGKIEKILVEESPFHPTIFQKEANPDDEYRKKELHAFRRSLFWGGVFRALGFALVLTGIGYLFSLIFDGIWYLAMLSGFFIGLVWSLNNNFDLNSFIESKKRLKIVKVIGWIILIMAIGYFGWVLVSKFI